MTRAEHENAYERRLYEEPRLVARPEILLVALFLASLPLYQPNESVFARIVPDGSMLAQGGMVGLASCALAGVVLAAFSLAGAGHAPGRGVTLTCAVLYAASQLACPLMLGTGAEGAWVLLWALNALGGATAAVVTLAWVRVWAMDFRNVAFYGAFACALASALTWVLSAAPVGVVRVAMPLMATVGSFAPAFMRVPEEASPAQATPTPASLPARLRDLFAVEWLPLLGLLICCFMMGLYELSIDERLVKSECTGGLIAAAIVVAACLAQRRQPLVVMLERLIIPVCAGVCVFLQSFPEGSPLFYAGALSVYTPFMLVSVFALASAVLFAHAGDFPAGLVVGVVLALTALASLLGKASAQLLALTDVNLGRTSWVLACFYFAVVIAELAFFAWHNAVWAGGPVPAEAAPASQMSDEERREAVCRQVTRRYGLTAREAEMFDYVSRGYGSTYISKKLFISPSTVRTHVKHVYAKLGVSSREELIALAEDQAACETSARE